TIDKPRVRLCVSDEGPGIEPAEREKVFEIFYQSQSAREARRAGTGIGLAIVREYVQAHRGSVHVEASTLSATGASFVVDLPLDLRKESV
ncbi:MAG: hypothetical protein H0V34_12945, partial [Gammaproteobacteria bacterium]|nr:hypothetical protein [Gammaproteobacteria bacterium]